MTAKALKRKFGYLLWKMHVLRRFGIAQLEIDELTTLVKFIVATHGGLTPMSYSLPEETRREQLDEAIEAYVGLTHDTSGLILTHKGCSEEEAATAKASHGG